MKRKQVLILLMAATFAAGSILAGCGGSAGSSASSASSASAEAGSDAEDEELDDEDADDEELDEEDAEQAEYDAWLAGLPLADEGAALADCIKLGEYKGLKLTKEVTKITDEAVQTYAKENAELTEITDKNVPVESGDTVNIAYVGEKDGVAFDGGTSDSYDLEIGSGTFIDGFEDGVIGMKLGETKDLDLTFPENYGSEELAGKAVVFHVTVNAINRPGEITDEDLANARKELEADYEQEALTVIQTDAWQQVKDNSEFLQLRKTDVDEYLAQANVELDAWIESLDMTKEEYLDSQGMSEEENQEEMDLYAREMAMENLLVDALSEAEGISADDQEYKDKLEALAKDSELTADELVEQAGEAAVYQYIMTERLLDRIIEYADVTVTEVDMDDAYDLEDYDYIDADDDEVEFEDLDEEELDADYEDDEEELTEEELEELLSSGAASESEE